MKSCQLIKAILILFTEFFICKVNQTNNKQIVKVQLWVFITKMSADSLYEKLKTVTIKFPGSQDTKKLVDLHTSGALLQLLRKQYPAVSQHPAVQCIPELRGTEFPLKKEHMEEKDLKKV